MPVCLGEYVCVSVCVCMFVCVIVHLCLNVCASEYLMCAHLSLDQNLKNTSSKT